LENYDFAEPAAQWLAKRFAPEIGENTTIAVDTSDFGKEFGGKGMEGMEPGWDGSRKTIAMGHTFYSACAVSPSGDTVMPLAFCFEKGRKPVRERLEKTVRAAHEATCGKGVFALDRSGDAEETLAFLHKLKVRAVVRVNKTDRDVFGTGEKIDKAFGARPEAKVKLRKPSGEVAALMRWRSGFYGKGHIPVLAVQSTLEGKTLHLYMLWGDRKEPAHDDPERERKLALHARDAAQAYLERWQTEVFFERIKQDFGMEAARVRTFKRLSNLFYLCVLCYAFCVHFVPKSESRHRILKIFKDNYKRVCLKMRLFLSGLRELLGQPRLNFISGRPRKPQNHGQTLFLWANMKV
jgi:hypothetical protein